MVCCRFGLARLNASLEALEEHERELTIGPRLDLGLLSQLVQRAVTAAPGTLHVASISFANSPSPSIPRATCLLLISGLS
jgi:hypothetical protein